MGKRKSKQKREAARKAKAKSRARRARKPKEQEELADSDDSAVIESSEGGEASPGESPDESPADRPVIVELSPDVQSAIDESVRQRVDDVVVEALEAAAEQAAQRTREAIASAPATENSEEEASPSAEAVSMSTVPAPAETADSSPPALTGSDVGSAIEHVQTPEVAPAAADVGPVGETPEPVSSSPDSPEAQPVSQHRGVFAETPSDVGSEATREAEPAQTDRQTPAPAASVSHSQPATAQRGGGPEGKPVVFLAFANDRDDTVGYLRNLPDEKRRTRAALERAEQAGLCEVVVRSNSTAHDIFKVFQDPRYRNRIAVFHYGGHANGYQLLLEGSSGESAAADAGGLASFIGEQDGLRLVFLNGCSTREQTEGLLSARVPVVISTSRAIDDKVATDFATQFYVAIAGGADIDTAWAESVATVRTLQGGQNRGLYVGSKKPGEVDEDRWPWDLHIPPGGDHAVLWNLPEAAGDPLFGLPPVPELPLPGSPYRHLQWYGRDHAEVFFGRGRQIRELYDRVACAGSAPVILFYGQSGAGKSSLLDAGLIPRLEKSHEWRYVRRDRDKGLAGTLAVALGLERGETVDASHWKTFEERMGRPLLVVVDQIEEVFTRSNPEFPNELDDFLQVVKRIFARADRPQGKLVLGFRKEWLAEIEGRFGREGIPRTRMFLERMDRDGVAEVVRGATQTERLRAHYGLSVEEGLAELVADDLLEDPDSAVAPTLQVLLTKMWDRAREANYERPRFDQQLYLSMKREGILLSDFLKQQLRALRRRHETEVESGLVIDLLALHTTSRGTAEECRLETLQEAYRHRPEVLESLLQRCLDLYLLTVPPTTQRETPEVTRLSHDTLAPLIRERFEESDKPGQRARRILDNRSVDWQDEREGAPLDAQDLELVEAGQDGTRALSDVERRLLQASRAERSRRVRLQRMLQGSAIAAVVMIVSFAAFAWKLRGDALEELGRNLVSELKFTSERPNTDFSAVVDRISDNRQYALPVLKQSAKTGRPSNVSGEVWCDVDLRIDYGKQRADAAIALLKLGEREAALELLRLRRQDGETGVDPETLTQFIHKCPERRVEASLLLDLLTAVMPKTSAGEDELANTYLSYALLLALEQYPADSLPDSNELTNKFLAWYSEHPSSAIHGATRWILRKRAPARLQATDEDLALSTLERARQGDLEWFVLKLSPAADGEAECYTFVVFEGPTPTVTQLDDFGGYLDELTAKKRECEPTRLGAAMEMPRFAICDREITRRQFSGDQEQPTWPALLESGSAGETWSVAEEFCRQLTDSEQAVRAGVTIRLPTAPQWECACRAGVVTPFSYGSDSDGAIQDMYTWMDVEPADVGAHRPSLGGLFDMHGNAAEWCRPANDGESYTLRSYEAINESRTADEADEPPGFRLSLEFSRTPAAEAAAPESTVGGDSGP